MPASLPQTFQAPVQWDSFPRLTRVCAWCKVILEDGGPGSAVTHGLGPCCWDQARAKVGLKPKPFPGRP